MLLLVRDPAFRGDLVHMELVQGLLRSGYDLRDVRLIPIRFDGQDDWLIRRIDGRLLGHPLMLRRHPPRRPRLPNRWNKSRATCTRRMEHRRNRRSVRAFIHAAPIAPAIRPPRVAIPPW